MEKPKDGCVKPSAGPILESPERVTGTIETKQEVKKMLARVGKPAPDFELAAFLGKGFKNIRLSDYRGKWIVICFYPGDFTFV